MRLVSELKRRSVFRMAEKLKAEGCAVGEYSCRRGSANRLVRTWRLRQVYKLTIFGRTYINRSNIRKGGNRMEAYELSMSATPTAEGNADEK